jgi:hypothetical protein
MVPRLRSQVHQSESRCDDVAVIGQIHAAFAQSIVIFFIILSVWALIVHFRNGRLSGNFWGIAAVGQILFVAQAILGVILLVQGRAPVHIVHVLYGGIGVLALPFTYGYLPRYRGRENLIVGIVCLFLVAVAIRAIDSARWV